MQTVDIIHNNRKVQCNYLYGLPILPITSSTHYFQL